MGAKPPRPERGLLDTSAFVHLGRLPDTELLPAEPMISTVTVAELAVGPLVARDDRERARRQAHLQWAEADFVPLPFDADAARAFGAVSASLRQVGRKPMARAFDSMIAAIAIANDLPIHTCNPADFEGIERLRVVPVPIPQ
jgi:predicted nucleic acid-binding protein